MRCCFPNLASEVGEIAPRVVLLLGRQVAEYVLAELDVSAFSFDPEFSYTGFIINGVAYVPVHHPSYVLNIPGQPLSMVDQHI